MIGIRKITTGEIQIVDATALPDGYDPTAWEVLGPVPEGVDPIGATWDISADAIMQDPAPLLAGLRAQRDMLMFASDPTQLADKDPAYREDWKAWRDLLLALPETVADPANPVWPIPPDADELTKLVGAYMAARTATAPTF